MTWILFPNGWIVWGHLCKFEKLSGSMSTLSTSIFQDGAKHLSLLHDKYLIVFTGIAPNNIVFVCKSHYVDWLLREIGIDNSHMATLHISRRHLRKRKSWTIIGLFYVLCSIEIQPKMKNWIYQNYSGFLNCTSVLSNSVILLGLPNASRNFFPYY
jgi:hypothetical protein